ncbi:transcriptional regulator [Companilactobacillus tucceti DSM 20183]|uniref:Transcriptional regulator n=1 Tax=Companilactobacillus tucceti DSM 20183 TaxID=1423811 RepID=A0A0R1JCT6_9LACO|nr:LacI family DNA-binding transcriptional regulator [Companilactobacillus tucceti]KRK65063.1 transcriptional regulator [Companilactobacillus tucceti DSM 20183]
MKPTINDVAYEAGVSKSTVSQFLNKRYQYMSTTTRQKIAEAIERLEYHPNQIAKSLKQKNTNVVAFICANLSSRFSLELLASIENYFQKVGYSVIIAKTDDDPNKERELIESFLARQIDGIIVFPTYENKEFYESLRKQKIPVMFVDRMLKGVDIPSVLLDNTDAGYEATELMTESGHKKIAILTLPFGDGITTRVERMEGYEQALGDKKIDYRPEYVINCQVEDVDDRLKELMSLDNPPTSLIVTNDMLLETVLMWVKKNNISIPDQLSLVGIDNVSFASLFTPEITTLAQPIMEIGEKASELLLKIIKGKYDSDKESSIIRYKPELHVRSSIKDV